MVSVSTDAALVVGGGLLASSMRQVDDLVDAGLQQLGQLGQWGRGKGGNGRTDQGNPSQGELSGSGSGPQGQGAEAPPPLAGGGAGGVPNSTANPQNIANAPRLQDQLRLESANSPFTASGQLAPHAVNDARLIIRPEELSNPAIPRGYGKYSTQTFQSPSGDFQVHFYKNPSTGDVLYELDYKAVLNKMSGVQRKP
ncbi:hypothetical protein CAI21_22540 [Alkalilimnicola ehrlichii]|nr:hypothetical protein CAI21_22540 [Alkalilimnicola ehrlichii]